MNEHIQTNVERTQSSMLFEGISLHPSICARAYKLRGQYPAAETLLIASMAELEHDFEFVKEINTITADRASHIFKLFPRVCELDAILCLHSAFLQDGTTSERTQEAMNHLQKLDNSERWDTIHRLKSIAAAIEKGDERIRPKTFDDAVQVRKI